MWSNFHTHSHYCDGKGAMREYGEQAVKVGIRQLGFSSHAPLPFSRSWCMKNDAFPDYLSEIESLKSLFPEIEVYKGLEVDYIPGLIHPGDFSPVLDYTIGSIHFVDSHRGEHWEIDNTFEIFREGLTNIFHGNIREAIRRYYALTREMLLEKPPDILGHLDKIKINSLKFYFEETEPWYRDEVDKTLIAIRESSAKVEVNTRGLYKKKSLTPYPSPWILERIHALRIPIMLSSDAHHPEDLVREFIPMADLLRDIGFTTLSVMKGGAWTEVPLNDL